MNCGLYEAAEREFFSAIEYYEECQAAGLGLRFPEEVYGGQLSEYLTIPMYGHQLI